MEAGKSPSDFTSISEQLAALTSAVQTLHTGYLQLQDRVERFQLPAPGTVNPLAAPLPSSPPPVRTAREPRMPMPERFSGDRSKFKAFFHACQIYFELQPQTFANEDHKVKFVISLLSGDPQTWAHQLLEHGSPCLISLDAFFAALAVIYDEPGRPAAADSALSHLKQGKTPVEEYVMEFRCLSNETRWNEPALKHQLRLGLSETLKDEVARIGVPETLEGLIHAAISVDRHLKERRLERASYPYIPALSRPALVPPVASATTEPGRQAPEPMQVGLLRPSLSQEEKNRRRQLGLCLYCGLAGHLLSTCPT